MKLEDLNKHVSALVGPALVEQWWDAPNKRWNGFSPRAIYERDPAGKREVEEYILDYAYGR